MIDNPAYKGKGRLCKKIYWCCALRYPNGINRGIKKEAYTKFDHDLRNSLNHIYGEHSNYFGFCKEKTPANENTSS